MGYRIAAAGTVLTYIPDHEPALGVPRFPGRREWTSGAMLAADADLLIHDAQYSAEEYLQHIGWGHSALPHTLAFATLTGVKHLVPFHHDPAHSDADRHRRSTQVSRKLQLLRAHGLIAPIRTSYRYRVTPKGQALMNAAVSIRSKAFPIELKAVA